jgi:hypothetical protein
MDKEFLIDNYLTNELVFKNTIIQIKKDFEFAGLELVLNDFNKIDFNKLAEVIKLQVNFLLHKNYAGFLNLLYRIDLSEAALKKQTKIEPYIEFELIVAELIIKRELQKVVTKEFYKKNSNEN